MNLWTRFSRNLDIGGRKPLLVRRERVAGLGAGRRLLFASDLHLRCGGPQRVVDEFLEIVRNERPDMVLLDMWARIASIPDSVYYDITWTGHTVDPVPAEFARVFEVVTGARDRAIERVQRAIASGETIAGYHVDDAARAHIAEAGFGDAFVHRTGHSIGRDVHGTGANMDNLETHDERRIIPRTCFSIEPGI